MSNKILFLLLICPLSFTENYLPENRKGDWFQAGYLRFLNNDLKVYKVNNVLDYGALNDGSSGTNNCQSITAAINDRDPGTLTLVCFPAGEYRILSPITIKNTGRLVLRGTGSEKTRLIFNFNTFSNHFRLFTS